MFTAEQAAAGILFCFVERTFFEKGVFWYPQTLFTAEQVATGVFFSEERHAFLKKSVLRNTWSTICNI